MLAFCVARGEGAHCIAGLGVEPPLAQASYAGSLCGVELIRPTAICAFKAAGGG